MPRKVIISKDWIQTFIEEFIADSSDNSMRDEAREPAWDSALVGFASGADPMWQQYKEFEYQFRNDLALWRKSLRTGQEYKPTSFPPSLVKEGNPLEIERRLLNRKWDYIEGLEQDHHFDLEFLILYYLKLQILHRLSVFNKEKGMETFQNISRVTV